MKRLIFFSALFVFTLRVFAVDTPIDITKNPPPPPEPNSFTQDLPVSASISETQLSIYFETSVGDATITVYDAYNNVVYQETVDTDSTPNVFISSSSWGAGDYSVVITYGTTTLSGYFEME